MLLTLLIYHSIQGGKWIAFLQNLNQSAIRKTVKLFTNCLPQAPHFFLLPLLPTMPASSISSNNNLKPVLLTGDSVPKSSVR